MSDAVFLEQLRSHIGDLVRLKFSDPIVGDTAGWWAGFVQQWNGKIGLLLEVSASDIEGSAWIILLVDGNSQALCVGVGNVEFIGGNDV